MTFDIPTHETKLQIQITLVAQAPCVLRMVGYDKEKENTIYINRGYGYRRKLLKGERTFTLHLPVSPETLTLKIDNNAGFDNVQMKKVHLEPLKTIDMHLTGNEQEFIEFAFEFARIAGYTDENKIIRTEDKQFIALYLPELKNRETGEILDTPARISRRTGIMEVAARKFKPFTVFMRIIILFHEYFHFDLNTRSEHKADFKAIDWALSLGIPSTEVMYAFTKVFPADNTNLKMRELNNIAYINKWHQQHAGKI